MINTVTLHQKIRIDKCYPEIIKRVQKKGYYSHRDMMNNFDLKIQDKTLLRSCLVFDGVIHDNKTGWLCEVKR